MEKTYNPRAIEGTWNTIWEERDYFAPSGSGTPYSIMIPPPNVTGSLHMGHAFQHTIMDALIRYKRMNGFNTLWQVGTDHAGIATQMVVERKIMAEQGKTRHDYGRTAFTEKIWEWKAQSGGTITQQMRRLGASVDWQSERFTMDDGFDKAVQEVFVRLYDDGLIYRGKRLVNWDPKLHTAISDLEVENREQQGHMWYLRYPLADGQTTSEGQDYIVVATTRPETMLGDTGVAVNPEDPRYQHLIGKEIILPLVGRRVPIVADHHADREKGTGCVKITPAHDFNDYGVGQRCHLPMISVITPNGDICTRAEAFNTDGSINTEVDTTIPEQFQGQERFAARQAVVDALTAAGLLEKIEDHTLMVPYGDRSGVVIEPLLTDQWFVRTGPLAEQAIQAVENGDIQFVPRQYENMYFSWMRDIQDWCISRQLWWGHRIPAWYDNQGNIYVARSEAEAREKHGLGGEIELYQDDDVLDTWFSSSLWTFATQGWPEPTERLQTFHPSDVLVTGFDIIFFWVARMIMMTMRFTKDADSKPQVPFKYVYMTGLIRDENGEKMSKSKGNVLDPLDMIDGIDLESLVHKRTGNMMQPQLARKVEKQTRKTFPNGIAPHGTDALRYTLYSLASTGRDINWDMKRLEGYRNFCNKIWNAANYVLMMTEGQTEQKQDKQPSLEETKVKLSLADRWIVSELQHVLARVSKNIDDFRLDHATQNLYDFIWNEYCAWYLELSKPVLWDESADSQSKNDTRRTLIEVLETICRMLHPFMPYITEEIWQQIKPLTGAKGDTIVTTTYPVADKARIDLQAETDITWLKGFITSIRAIRAEMNLGPNKPLEVILRNTSEQDQRRLHQNRNFLISLAKLSSLTTLKDGEAAPMSATQLVGDMEVLVPMAGLIDKDKELARLGREVERIQKEVARCAGKLANEKFVNSAPAPVIDKERTKLADAKNALHTMEQQIAAIKGL